MISSFLLITPDRWLIVSGLFVLLALFIPKRIPLIVSGTTFVTGTISFIYPFLTKSCPLSTTIQLTIFFVLLILSLLFIHAAPPASAQHPLRKEDVFALTSPIKKGKGTLTWGEKSYTLVGPHCPAQTLVTVVSVQGDTVYISPIKKEVNADD